MKINGILDCYHLDDGTIMIEIYGSEWRVGICVGNDTNESAMWLVQKDNYIKSPHTFRIFDLFPKEFEEMFTEINAREKPYELERWEDDGGRC